MLIGLAFSEFAAAVSLNGLSSNEMSSLGRDYLETDYVEIRNQTPYVLGNSVFMSENLSEINSSGLFAEIVEGDDTVLNVYDPNKDEMAAINCCHYIKLDNFFKNRIMTNDITGEFPSDAGEIILGEELAVKLFDSVSNALNSTVTVSLFSSVQSCKASGGSVELRICGVNNTKNAQGGYFSYIPYTVGNELRKASAAKGISIIKKDIKEYMDIAAMGIFDSNVEVEILTGRLPQDNNEIAVSSDMLNYLLMDEGLMELNTEELAVDDKNNLVNGIFSGKYMVISDVSVKETKIVGVYKANEDTLIVPDVVVLPELEEELLNPSATLIEAYLIEDIETLKNSELYTTYDCYIVNEYLSDNIMNKTQPIVYIVAIAAVVILILALFVIYIIISMSIVERKKEIGILKGLGASNSTILKIFISEQVICGIIGGVLSIILYILAMCVITKVMYQTILGVQVGMAVFFGVFGTAIMIGFCFGPLHKIMEMKPIDAIRF